MIGERNAAYCDFSIVPETETGGWVYGAITVFGPDCDNCGPDGCDTGDGFVVAPDGTRAGLVWSYGREPPERILEPDEDRWGVFEVNFPRRIKTLNDLCISFRGILPFLQQEYGRTKQGS